MTEQWLMIRRRDVEELRHILSCHTEEKNTHRLNQAKILLRESLRLPGGVMPDKWEYIMESLDEGLVDDGECQLKELNHLGIEGWEVVHIVYHPGVKPQKMILKRKIVG